MFSLFQKIQLKQTLGCKIQLKQTLQWKLINFEQTLQWKSIQSSDPSADLHIEVGRSNGEFIHILEDPSSGGIQFLFRLEFLLLFQLLRRSYTQPHMGPSGLIKGPIQYNMDYKRTRKHAKFNIDGGTINESALPLRKNSF